MNQANTLKASVTTNCDFVIAQQLTASKHFRLPNFTDKAWGQLVVYAFQALPNAQVGSHVFADDFANQPPPAPAYLFTYMTHERLLERLKSDFLFMHLHVAVQSNVTPANNSIAKLIYVSCKSIKRDIHTVGIRFHVIFDE